MSKVGAPTSYTQDVADEIVRQLSEGVPLASICRAEGMPAVRTVSDWRKAHPEFGELYAAARDDGFDALAAQCLEIADDEREDWTLSKKGVLVDEAAIARSRLRVDTRLKLLAKWDPRRYGERLALANDREDPITGASDEQLDARIKELLAKRAGGTGA